jgi:two-component system chemotaxis response regulator CheB
MAMGTDTEDRHREGPIPRSIIVIGTSAGGISALQEVLGGLPDNLPATIAIVMHRSASHDFRLAPILQRFTRLPVVEPAEPVPIKAGTVYLAPRDQHLQMTTDSIEAIHGPKENFSRPAIDVLFRSAAIAHGPQVVGVLLSGFGHDGVAGMVHIKREGGFAIVQNPREARASAMPRNALLYDHVDLVLPLQRMPTVFGQLVRGEPIEPKA